MCERMFSERSRSRHGIFRSTMGRESRFGSPPPFVSAAASTAAVASEDDPRSASSSRSSSEVMWSSRFSTATMSSGVGTVS